MAGRTRARPTVRYRGGHDNPKHEGGARREMLDKLIENIAGIITALATGSTALLMWRSNRREVAREGTQRPDHPSFF